MRTLKINISVIVLLFVNFLFVLKYSSRYTYAGIYIAFALLVLQYLVFRYGNKIRISENFKKRLTLGAVFYIIGLVVISHFLVPVDSLNVDRWSVISSFMTELFNGNYPYYAKSHMGNYPGPMPLYFLIAMPFYYIGELSILSCAGYCIIILMMNRNKKGGNWNFMLFYLATSLYLIWEIIARSNIFTYTVFILLLLNSFKDLKSINNLRFFILAVLTGLLLSTRSIYILVYIIFFISFLNINELTFRRLVLFLSIALIAFISTFLPLILIYKSDFLIMNPFVIQSSFLVPGLYTLVFIAFSLLLAFLVKNRGDRFFYSGITLFISILIYSVFHLAADGYEIAFINSKIDISYFIFCIPFLISYILQSNEIHKDPVSEEQIKHSH